MVEDNDVVRQLRGIAAKLSRDWETQRDLLQEMFVHLIKVQTETPGQTRSWYIKSCEFHARNHLKLGRSIDSPKRARNRVLVGETSGSDDNRQEAGTVETNDPSDRRGEIFSHDLVERITPHLSNKQLVVLELLMKGYGIREIGRKLGITHPAVIKHRKKIARIAREIMSEGGGYKSDNGDHEVGIFAVAAASARHPACL
jgi:RNA polymerase sigma factor (sigma-70 family)